jgi:hypothetical protein
MDHVIAWCGFLGAWLLVAGPLHQATRELEEEEIERDDMAAVAKSVSEPEPVPKWWWLLPPVAYVLHRRRSDEYRRRIVAAMPPEQLAAFESFRDKAEAWIFVAGGASLIAIEETWGLHEVNGWPEGVFWALIVAMAAISIVNAVGRARRRRSGPLGSDRHSLG